MPASAEPAQQQPMAVESSNVITQQPNTSEQQPDMSHMTLRGGEEAGCSFCCGLCDCEESCC
ncbi:hypothetical protein C2857_005568 [Epichloe festucae Fl1]|uniref:Uncharacterized protein n=1 Tax=Epichloe festucae (strain Fl1) TaxID=877507 RepID=A0A7S9KPT6_EPIFF|nr:hypothetical protein C2857_005568 [Epichloe festucae Fl1]